MSRAEPIVWSQYPAAFLTPNALNRLAQGVILSQIDWALYRVAR